MHLWVAAADPLGRALRPTCRPSAFRSERLITDKVGFTSSTWLCLPHVSSLFCSFVPLALSFVLNNCILVRLLIPLLLLSRCVF